MTNVGLKSDNFCGYNQSASPFFYTFQPEQYKNTYVVGEVGVIPQGGGAGSYIRSDVIDVSSFLSGRDDVLSKCLPPVPSLDSIRKEPLTPQDKDTTILLSKYTKNLRSENNIDSIDYNRYQTLLTEPQNLRFVIEDFSAERGGLPTQQFVKNSWTNQNNVKNFNKNLCKTMLDPSRACEDCSETSGYPGVDFITGKKLDAVNIPLGLPPNDSTYPFVDVTSQQVFAVNNHCGPQEFYGINYDKGSCPTI